MERIDRERSKVTLRCGIGRRGIVAQFEVASSRRHAVGHPRHVGGLPLAELASQLVLKPVQFSAFRRFARRTALGLCILVGKPWDRLIRRRGRNQRHILLHACPRHIVLVAHLPSGFEQGLLAPLRNPGCHLVIGQAVHRYNGTLPGCSRFAVTLRFRLRHSQLDELPSDTIIRATSLAVVLDRVPDVRRFRCHVTSNQFRGCGLTVVVIQRRYSHRCHTGYDGHAGRLSANRRGLLKRLGEHGRIWVVSRRGHRRKVRHDFQVAPRERHFGFWRSLSWGGNGFRGELHATDAGIVIHDYRAVLLRGLPASLRWLQPRLLRCSGERGFGFARSGQQQGGNHEQHRTNHGGNREDLVKGRPHYLALGQAGVAPEKLLDGLAAFAGQARF